MIKKDIFKTKCEAIVNPVNIVGVMGAGLAKSIKDKYPEVFEKYVLSCKNNELDKRLTIGKCLTVKANDGKYIINLPTKKHFKDPSKMEYVEQGLDALIKHIHHFKIKSVAIPALGAGLGGLEWEQVKKLINYKLNNLTLSSGEKVEIEIYDPIFQPYKKKNIDSLEI